jgi:hypothetical protein
MYPSTPSVDTHTHTHRFDYLAGRVLCILYEYFLSLHTQTHTHKHAPPPSARLVWFVQDLSGGTAPWAGDLVAMKVCTARTLRLEYLAQLAPGCKSSGGPQCIY